MAIEIGPALGLTADSKGIVAATGDLHDLKSAAGDAQKAADSLVGAEKRAGDEAKKMGDKAGQAATETEKLGRASKTTDGAMMGLATRAAGIAGALAALAASALSIGGYIRLADAWSDMRSQIGAATGDMEGASGMMQRLVDIANASYSPLDQTVQVYARNVGVLRDLGKTAADAADFTESLNHMLVITATKGERAASVQGALAKAMAVGVLQADGLETVLANGGRVAEALAKQLGTTVSGLRALASEGKITGKVIADAIINPLEDVRAAAAEMPATVGDAFVRIGTNLTALVGNFDQATGASAALAQPIISLADWIGELAQADFAAWGDSALNVLTLLGQGVLLLAATRIPALVASMMAVNVSGGLMTAQFVAGALASRGMTVAIGLQAAAVRGLSAAFTLLGGVPGLLALAITGVGLAMYNNRNEAKPLAESLGAVATAQRDLNAAMLEYSQTGDTGALGAARTAADDAVARLNEALALAEKALTKAQGDVQFAGAGDSWLNVDDTAQSRIDMAMASVTKIKDELAAAAANQAALNTAWQEQADIIGVAADELTADQIKARDAANEMLMASQRRVELLAIEKQFGSDSVAFALAQTQAERNIYFAKVATLQVSDAIKNQLRQAWLEEQAALGKTQAWNSAMNVLKASAADVLANARSIAATEPSGSWLNAAIAQAKNLAAGLWDAVGGLRALGSTPVPGMDTGSADWGKNSLGFTLPGKELLNLPEPTGGGGGSGGGGGGGGGTDDRQSGLESLITELQTEREVVDAWRLENLAKIAEYNDMELAAVGGQNEAKIRLEAEYQERLRGIIDSEKSFRLSETAGMFEGLASLAAAGGKKALRAQAVLSAAATMIAGYETAMKAAAEAKTIPGRIAAYAQFLGMGLKAAASIRSAGGVGGGSSSGGSTGTGASTATAAAPAAPQDVIIDFSATMDPTMRALAAALLNPMIDAMQKASKTGINIVAVKP